VGADAGGACCDDDEDDEGGLAAAAPALSLALCPAARALVPAEGLRACWFRG